MSLAGYQKFLQNKQQLSGNFGFNPVFIPDRMFDFRNIIILDSNYNFNFSKRVF